MGGYVYTCQITGKIHSQSLEYLASSIFQISQNFENAKNKQQLAKTLLACQLPKLLKIFRKYVSSPLHLAQSPNQWSEQAYKTIWLAGVGVIYKPVYPKNSRHIQLQLNFEIVITPSQIVASVCHQTNSQQRQSCHGFKLWKHRLDHQLMYSLRFMSKNRLNRQTMIIAFEHKKPVLPASSWSLTCSLSLLWQTSEVTICLLFSSSASMQCKTSDFSRLAEQTYFNRGIYDRAESSATARWASYLTADFYL